MWTVFSGRSKESRSVILPVVSSIWAENVFSVAEESTTVRWPPMPQLQLTEEARIVMEESDIRRARRIDIAGDTGCAKCLAVN